MKDAPSVDPCEIAKFSAMSDAWWDPNGKFAPLHKFQPIRRAFIRETALRHFARSGDAPFAGLSLIDIGCGGGLMAEPMAEAGFAVTGVDAAEKNIAAAKLHAAKTGVDIDYRHDTAEAMAASGAQYDVVLNLEVIEHVADLPAYMAATSKLVRPGGLMFVASLNKTLKSLALAKIGAEYVLRWLPKGTHDWSRFVPPAKIQGLLRDNGLDPFLLQGVSFDPLSWEWTRSGDTSVNYLVVSRKSA